MPKILVMGSSHTVAIAKAAEGIENLETLWVKNPRSNSGPGDVTVDESLAVAGALEPTDILAITWFGTYHNIFGLLQHEQPFDFFEPGGDENISPDIDIIPYAVLHDQFASMLKKDKSLGRMVKSSKAKTILLATPPVKGDNDFIKGRTKKYRGSLIAEVGITPAPVRAKLWRLEMRCIEAHCTAVGISFLRAPADSFDPDGFLRPDLYGSDATHANEKYGAMVIDQLRTTVNHVYS